MATTSKAFRARAFDANRSMTVFWGNELPDLAECSVGNRAVTQMPSGMEKEEEMESHLQDAILAQQASTSGVQVNHVIPTPRVNQVDSERYHRTYQSRNKTQRTKYIKVHAWQALERDEPEYDYDTEDETWLAEHTHVEPRILEKIFDTVESHSSETQIASEDSVVNMHKTLDSSIVYEVYEYWLSKRTSAAHTSGCIGVGGLIPRVRTECRKDGQGAVNPYVAFRRRAEKMQTRKNRKNDEDSYEKILKLVHDMSKAQQLFDMTARREKQKLALIDMEAEILAKRMEMADFGAANAFNEFAEKMRLVQEAKIGEINGSSNEEKKRKKVRRRIADRDLVSKAWLKRNAESWNRPPSLFGQGAPGVQIAAKPTREALADGRFAFKRRRGCIYRAALPVWPVPPPPATIQMPPPPPPSKSAESLIPTHMRFYPTHLSDGKGGLRSIGMARRRVGRGGRVLFDRMPTLPTASTDPWAEYCVADSTKTFRARNTSLGTEEETDELDAKTSYFARSDRCRFDDEATEQEWTGRYRRDEWRELEESVQKFKVQLQQQPPPPLPQARSSENDDSEVERMDGEGHEDEAQITINGHHHHHHHHSNDKNEEEEEDQYMDVDDPPPPSKVNGGKKHSPPIMSGNGRADRAEPTPVPAKMCGTVVSDYSDEWREPSGSPSESNSSTEWGGYTREHVAVALKAKLMNVEVDEEPSPARARDHSIKDSMSTVTMLERKKFMLSSTIGM